MLNPIHFQELDSLCGPHTVDQFASLNSKKLPRFCAKWLFPGCEGVNAFTQDWRGENNWLVPTVYLIPRVLRHMTHNGESGTLVVTFWLSAPWWPLLLKDSSNFHDFVVIVWIFLFTHSLSFQDQLTVICLGMAPHLAGSWPYGSNASQLLTVVYRSDIHNHQCVLYV